MPTLADKKRTYYLNALGLGASTAMSLSDLESLFYSGSGGGGGSSSLTVVNGGTVTLDDSKPEGYLAGYRVKATTTFVNSVGNFVALTTGVHLLEKTATGWSDKTSDDGTPLVFSVPVTNVLENFNRTDGTTMNGKTSTNGSATLISPVRSINAGGVAVDAAVLTNRISVPGGASNENRGVGILAAKQNYETSVDYVISTAASSHQVRIAVRANVADDNTNAGNSIILIIKGDGSLSWEENGSLGGTLAGSGISLTGKLTLRAFNTTFSAFVNGVQVGSSWTSSKAGTYTVAGAYNTNTAIDNFEVVYL